MNNMEKCTQVLPCVKNDVFWERLERELPPVFARAKVGAFCGGIIASGTLANLDYQGKGPSVRVRIGKQIGYERASFIRWLRERSSSGQQ